MNAVDAAAVAGADVIDPRVKRRRFRYRIKPAEQAVKIAICLRQAEFLDAVAVQPPDILCGELAETIGRHRASCRLARQRESLQIGRASCRARVCQYV